MSRNLRNALAVIVFVATLFPISALAQIAWLNPEGKQGLQFEFTAGSFKTVYFLDANEKIVFPTSSSFLTVRGRVAPWLSALAELTYFTSKYELNHATGPGGKYKSSHSGVANPYFGFEVSKEGSSALLNIGMRLPVISETNTLWAVPSQYISSHRFLAYLNQVLQISTNFGIRQVDRSGSGVRATIGGQLAVPDRGDAEFFLDLATNIWHRFNKARFMAAFSNLYLVTESGAAFGDRHWTSVSFSADVTLGQFDPGIHVQFPLGKNLTNVINNNYGIHLAYFFPTGTPMR